VFFGTVMHVEYGPIATVWPNFETVQVMAVGLALLAAFLLLWQHMNLLWVLLICAALSGTIAMI
jgi:hypothetical protein